METHLFSHIQYGPYNPHTRQKRQLSELIYSLEPLLNLTIRLCMRPINLWIHFRLCYDSCSGDTAFIPRKTSQKCVSVNKPWGHCKPAQIHELYITTYTFLQTKICSFVNLFYYFLLIPLSVANVVQFLCQKQKQSILVLLWYPSFVCTCLRYVMPRFIVFRFTNLPIKNNHLIERNRFSFKQFSLGFYVHTYPKLSRL